MINTGKDLASQTSPIFGLIYLQLQFDASTINLVVMGFLSLVVGFFSIRKSIFETRKIKDEHELLKKQLNENRQK
jgi:hypothetical protein